MQSAALNHAIEAEQAPRAHFPRRETTSGILKQVIANNGYDDSVAEYAVRDALTDNRAAFWVAREGRHHAIACCVMHTACRKGSLALGLELEITTARMRGWPETVRDVLDYLIPLNTFAVAQLMDAYEEHCSTFVSREELVARRDRVAPAKRVA